MMNRARSVQAGPADDRDAEARALWDSPTFQSLLAEGRESDSASLDEIDLSLGKLSSVEQRRVDAYLDTAERLVEEQGREVTDEQGRLVRLVLLAADYARGDGTLERLATDGGFAPARVRAVASALQALGLKAPARVG